MLKGTNGRCKIMARVLSEELVNSFNAWIEAEREYTTSNGPENRQNRILQGIELILRGLIEAHSAIYYPISRELMDSAE